MTVFGAVQTVKMSVQRPKERLSVCRVWWFWLNR